MQNIALTQGVLDSRNLLSSTPWLTLLLSYWHFAVGKKSAPLSLYARWMVIELVWTYAVYSEQYDQHSCSLATELLKLHLV